MRIPSASSAVVLLAIGTLSITALRAEARVMEAPASSVDDPFRDCEEALRRQPELFESSKCFYQIARGEGRWEGAQQRLRVHIDRRPDLPWPKFYFALIAMDLDEPRADEGFAEAAQAFAEVGDAVGETYSHINRARIAARAGDFARAVRAAQDAEASGRRGGDVALTAEVRRLDLDLRLQRGDDRVGLQRQLRKLEVELPANASYALRRDTRLLLAEVAFLLGEYGEASALYSGLAALAEEANDRPGVATASLNALHAELATERSRPSAEEARRRAAATVEVALDSGSPGVIASSHLTHGRLTPGSAGIEALERGLKLALRLEDPDLERDALGYLALRHLESDPALASRLAERAVWAAERSSDPLARIYGWHAQLAVAWRIDGRGIALERAAGVLERVDRASHAEADDTGRARLFAVWSEIHLWVAGRLLRDYREHGDREALALAFAAQERMRTRDLGSTAGARDRPISLAELERSLVEEEAVLSFQFAPETSGWGTFYGGAWLSLTTRHGTELYPIPGPEELVPKIAMFRALLERRDGSDLAAGRQLFRTLLEEPLATLPLAVERLVIVPDATLHQLPFAALRTTDARPLATVFELSTVASASARARLKEGEAAAVVTSSQSVGSPNAVAFADPAVVYATAAARDEATGSEASIRSSTEPLRDWPGALQPLDFARREGRALRRRLGDSCRLYSGAAATETAAKGAARIGPSILHFATHAVVDSRRPERSTVILAPTSQDDGLLEADEIARLELPRSLVVLSTCEGAGGPLLRGEGAMSLARAFFRGGARTVVASLWRLRDREAAAIFDDFYAHLSRGASVGEALRRAQEDQIAAGAPTRAWAGLVVFGDGDWAPVSQALRPRWGVGAAVVLVVIAGGLLVWGRLRRGRSAL